MRILIIEDNEDDVYLVQQLLREAPALSVDLVHARSLKQALDDLAKGGIEVILSDLNLPDSQGLGTFAKLAVHARAVPILILTGSHDEETLALAAIRNGAQDYLEKNQINGWGLRRAIRYAIERKQIELALQEANQKLQQELDNITWLNRIMMEREAQIDELKEQVRMLKERSATQP